MFVKIHDSVPDDKIPDYLTRGKEYPFVIDEDVSGFDGGAIFGTISDDRGAEIYIGVYECCHLFFGRWELFEK